MKIIVATTVTSNTQLKKLKTDSSRQMRRHVLVIPSHRLHTTSYNQINIRWNHQKGMLHETVT